MKLAENVPEHLFRNAKLQTIVDQLFENFEKGKEKNAETVNRFFNQSFFRGGESFIDECAKIDEDIDFDYIKDEGLSLSLLLDDDNLRLFQVYLNRINGNIEKAIKQEIFDKIKSKIGNNEPYSDFDERCGIDADLEKKDENKKYEFIIPYFKKIIEYLKEKENLSDGKNVEEILSGLLITNEEINNRLPTREQIPTGVPLKDSTIPESTRKSFDALLSFEIGKVADCARNITNDIHSKLEPIFANSMPTINTIVGEDDELKFDENKLGDEFKKELKSYQKNYASALQTYQKEIEPIESEIQNYEKEIQNYEKEIETIESNTSISKDEKEQQINNKKQEINDREQQIRNKEKQINKKKQQVIKIENEINDFKRKSYLEDLKKKDSSLGETLELLYQNNFDYSKLDENPEKNKEILQKYLNKVADIRLKISLENGTFDAIKENFGNREDFDEFKKFYKDLVNLDEENIEFIPEDKIEFKLDDGTTTKGIKLPIKKEIIGGAQPLLKQIDKFGNNGKSYDTLPIRYTIEKSAIDSLPISKDEKENLHKFLSRVKTDGKEGVDENGNPTGKIEGGNNYIIEGADIGILSYLFFTINGRSLKTESSSKNQKEVEKILENKEGGTEDDENKLTPEQFQEKMESLGSCKFENGSEIWLPMGNSELPGGGYQWMKIKISDINMGKGTFKGTIFGGELKFKNKLEGKSKEFNMSQNFFDDLDNIVSKASADKDKIWLLPDPNKSNFEDFKDNLKGKLGTSKFSFPPEGENWGGTTRNGNKFIKKDSDGKEIEIKHFGVPGDDKSTYKVEYNPHRKSFTVSSTFNGEEKGKDGKSEKKRFAYKREMDWNNFLIFFTQKGLIPQTEEETKNAIKKQNLEFVNGGNRKLYWFSLNNLKNGFKDIIGSLKKGIDDYDKKRTKEFKDRVEGPMLRALSKMPLRPSLEYAVGKRQEEIYNEQYNGAWPKIEEYLKALQSDEQFADTFDQVPDHVQTFYGESYKQFITELFKKGDPEKEERYKAAALLLANIQKGGSPYRGLPGYENSGLWVKVLLGNDHYDQFKKDKEDCINDLKNAGDKRGQIEDVLATCEMDYIINNINGSNGKLKYFGSHEKRGIPGKEETQYIPNPSKILLSEKFAKELKNSYKGRFDKSAVESSFSEIKHNDFNLAREDFLRFIKSGRFPQAISNLKKMFTLADDDDQKSDYQKCFLIYMLSGILDFNGKEDLRKQAYQRAKTMSFLPGMLAKNVGHSEQVAALLDDWSGGDFSKNVKSYFRKEDLIGFRLINGKEKGKVEIEKLIKEVNGWWDNEKMKNFFEKYSKSSFPSKKFPEGSILNKLQKDALKSDMENIDNSLLTNDVVANSGGILSNANVVRDRMQIKDGEFDGTENKEKDNRKKFWRQIIAEVNNIDYKDPENVKLVLNQYFSWFGLNSESDRQKAYQWVKTAYFRKEHVRQPYEFDYTGKGKPEGFLNMGTISMEEIEDIIWYTFQGTVRKDHFSSRKLPPEMEGALEAFQKFFRNAFNKGTLENPTVERDVFKSSGLKVDIMLLGSRDLYKDIFSGDSETTLFDGDVPDDVNLKKDAKQRRKAQKKAFQSGRFINHEIAQIEKTFKNRLPKTSYRVVTQDTSSDIETRIKWKIQKLNENENEITDEENT